MAQFKKFKFLHVLELNFKWVQFYKEIFQFGFFKKLRKIRKQLEKIEYLHIVKFEAENFEHLQSNTGVN